MTAESTTDLVRRAAVGDRDALDRLFSRLHGEIKKIVRSLLKGRGRDIEATDVVDRVYERLIKQRDPKWNDRTHFLRFVVLAARRAISDLPRPTRFVELHTAVPLVRGAGITFWDLNACLDRLEKRGKTGARIVEVVLLRCLTDLTWNDIATAIDASERTVKGDWTIGQAFIQRCLKP